MFYQAIHKLLFLKLSIQHTNMNVRIKKPTTTETTINIVSKENHINIDGENFHLKTF